MKKVLVLLLVALGLGATIFFFSSRQIRQDRSSDSNSTEETNSNVSSSYTTLSNPEDNESGIYTDYSESLLSESNTNVIFFAAKWCPSCNQLDKNLQESKDEIPEGLIILKADYDLENDLKKKYGVTIQHTLVQVDGNGELIKKWNGLYDQYELDDILNELN